MNSITEDVSSLTLQLSFLLRTFRRAASQGLQDIHATISLEDNGAVNLAGPI